jgi:hypothetical protein
MKLVLWCTQETQCTAGLSCERSWNTHTTNTATCSEPSESALELALLHGNTRYVILIDVIQTLMCFDDWISVSVQQEV